MANIPQSVTIKIDHETFKQFESHAKLENMSIEEFICTAAQRYVDQNELIDEFELSEILEKEKLLE